LERFHSGSSQIVLEPLDNNGHLLDLIPELNDVRFKLLNFLGPLTQLGEVRTALLDGVLDSLLDELRERFVGFVAGSLITNYP
jgi:hypothetical protein